VNDLLKTDDVNVQDSDGNTPLHIACQFGNVDIVKSLLSVLANTNITNDDKNTALEHAKYYGNNELVSFLSLQLLSKPADAATNVMRNDNVPESTSDADSVTNDIMSSADTTTNVTTSASVTQSTPGITSITDVTISDVHSREQHERKRVSFDFTR
jgi:ankyrin repeat protein